MNTLKFTAFLIVFFISLAPNDVTAAERRINFDEGWKFHRGSVANAEQPSFNDTKWRLLDLPHDWSVEPVPVQKEGITVGPFSRLNEGGAGGADVGQTLGGEGWYRKEFTIPAEDAGKLFSLYFEGAYNQAEVWINGKKACFNAYGYMPFRIKLNEYCNAPGQPNMIAVRVVNAGENSRWYAGSGIYRHVWLIRTDKVYLDKWDTYVDASTLQGKTAVVNFSTVIHNPENLKGNSTLNIRVLDADNREVYTDSREVALSNGGEVPISFGFNLKNAQLWSVDEPFMYTVRVSVSADGKSDEISIPFGIRTLSFDAKQGFLLNGKPLELKGGCLHHDNGLLGAAAFDRAEEKKVELMKANGYNAVRAAHNLPSEYFLDVCDRLGMLVIDEVFDQWQEPKRSNDYHQYFDEWSDKDMSTMVRRDRNHPSVIMWSIGNEIAQRADPVGEEIAKRLVNTIHKYDKSRFTTAGVNDFWDRRHMKYTWDKDSERAFRNIDVAGYNYMWQKYESDHSAHPDRVIYGSESYPKEAAQNWNLVEKHPYIIGDFVWTSIDYLGEAGLGHALELADGEHNPQFMGYPWYNAWCGDIDLCGDKKPQSYFRDVLWREREISMAVRPPVAAGKKEVVNGWGWTDELLSWTWKGLEGQPMRVNVYSRSPQVRLYLNNKLVGEKEVDQENYTATFEVMYEPGVLKAVNVVKKKETASMEFKTAGAPAAIRLTADRTTVRADKNDLAYVKIEITDAEGNVVPDARIPVKIECTGNGKVAASGNAAYDDVKSFRSLTPETFRGRAIAVLQPDATAGDINLTVSSEGLPDSKITIHAGK